MRRGTARGSGRTANFPGASADFAGVRGAAPAAPRGMRPPMATRPASLPRKVLREQCGFTGSSVRRDKCRKEKKRNGFGDVNHFSRGCQTVREIISRKPAPSTRARRKTYGRICGPQRGCRISTPRSARSRQVASSIQSSHQRRASASGASVSASAYASRACAHDPSAARRLASASRES